MYLCARLSPSEGLSSAGLRAAPGSACWAASCFMLRCSPTCTCLPSALLACRKCGSAAPCSFAWIPAAQAAQPQLPTPGLLHIHHPPVLSPSANHECQPPPPAPPLAHTSAKQAMKGGKKLFFFQSKPSANRGCQPPSCCLLPLRTQLHPLRARAAPKWCPCCPRQARRCWQQ